MIRTNIFAFIILNSVLVSTPTYANQSSVLNPEPNKEEAWTVNYLTENSVHTSVNGQITHGDRLHIRLVKNHCMKGNLLTFVYSTQQGVDFNELKNKLISSRFAGQNAKVKILYTAPFIAGHRATVDMGWIDLESLTKILETSDPIRMELLDTSDFQISRYFDVMQNSWSNKGLRTSLERAVQMCKSL
jgi:hypothetical protein